MAVDASPGAGRVLIASSGGPLTAEPSWTRHDNVENCKCYGFDWERGRQSEFDVTNTGTARVYFHDLASTFDETFVGKQAMLQLFDPTGGGWQPVFRGHIDVVGNAPSPGAPELTNVELELVDLFDYLSGVRMVVGEFGVVPLPGAKEGIVHYAEAPVDERIEDLGADAGLPGDLLVVFTGNIDVHDTDYDTDDDILSAMRQAADAEFPGVGNIYVDRYGRVVFHGRFAKFDPDGTASGAEWDFQRWAAATREDVTSGRAQIRVFQYSISRSAIVNSYVAWPERDLAGEDFSQAEIPGMTKTNPTSITAYGYRGREAPALIIKAHKTNGNSGDDECELFGDYYVGNYADPRKRVDRIEFLSLPETDDRAADVWAIFAADISDVIHLFVDEAGMSDDEFFIEGISGRCRVGTPDYDLVSFTPNLSPAAYYTDNVFEEA